MNRFRGIVNGCLAFLFLFAGFWMGWADNSTTPTKPFTFGFETTARSSEVNSDFDTLYTGLANIGRANIITDGVGSDEIQAGAVGYSELSTKVDTLGGYHANLYMEARASTTSKITLTADAVTCSDGSNSIVVKNLNLSLDMSGSIGPGGPDSAATVGNKFFYPYVIAKSDGTAALVGSESSSAPDLTNGAFNGYTMYFATAPVTNTASGSWDLLEFRLTGSSYNFERAQRFAGIPNTYTTVTASLGGFIPSGISRQVHISYQVAMSSSTNPNASCVYTDTINVTRAVIQFTESATTTVKTNRFEDPFYETSNNAVTFVGRVAPINSPSTATGQIQDDNTWDSEVLLLGYTVNKLRR